MAYGLFVTFEGPEGAGKTTLIRALEARVREAGMTPVVTREPGAGEFGKVVRSLLLEGGEIAHAAELFLFLADRAQHVETLIKPALEEGKVVLCDRHADSTYVYQAVARGLDPNFVRQANTFATGGLKPDLTFLLDLPAEAGLARLSNREGGQDRLDRAPLEFHQKVRQGFLDLAAEEPGRIILLDATQDPKNVESAAFATLSERTVHLR